MRSVTKQPVNYTLDIPIIQALHKYEEDIKLTLPENIRKKSGWQSGIVNGILKDFLVDKGYMLLEEKV